MTERTLYKLKQYIYSLAGQRKGSELEPEEHNDADFEGAWDSIIDDARKIRDKITELESLK